MAKYGPRVYKKVKIVPSQSFAIAKVASGKDWVQITVREDDVDISQISIDLLHLWFLHGHCDIITITGNEIFLEDVVDIIKRHNQNRGDMDEN